MPASIRTTLHSSPGGPVVGSVLVDQSREDLRKGYQIVLESVNAHTTYAWSISFKPESPNRTDSSAALLPPENANGSVAKFNVDFEGAYLIRLVVDAGLPSEDVKYLRCRFQTRFGNLKLVAAGERRDENGLIPLDATAEGWSNDQNQNLQLILAQIRRQATTGRVLWVDANRGRDYTDNANDPTVTYAIPGSDPASSADDLTFTAEAHGDFSTINEAITYAAAAASRGEPAPSAADPYFIRVKPGAYTEDLVLQAHIHIVGDDWSRAARTSADGSMPVVVLSANAGGNTHGYSPGGNTNPCYLSNLSLVNRTNTTTPLLSHTRGVLILDNCVVYQSGNHASQGPAISSVSANSSYLVLHHCLVQNDAATSDACWALVVDSDTATALWVQDTQISGRSALSFNESCYAGTQIDLRDTVVNAGLGYCLRSGGSILAQGCTFTSSSAAKNVVVDGFGASAGANSGDVDVHISNSSLTQVIFDRTFVGGDANWQGSSITLNGATPDVWLQAPGGALSETVAATSARTLLWHSEWRLPQNQPAGVQAVPVNSKFPYRNLQDVLDLLANVLNPQAAAIGGAWPNTGGLTLNAAYDGVNSYSPFAAGAGLGRIILADNGAVQILGALNPGEGIVDPDLNGGLQVDGPIDVGPVVGDGLGSELFLEPNPFGYGPRFTLGRAIWHNELTVALPQPRPAPAAVVRGGLNDSNGGYALWLMTRSSQGSSTGEQGRLILSAGRTNEGGDGDTDGAGIYLTAGDVLETSGTGAGGHIWLTPGYTGGGGTHGVIRVVDTTAATPMVILAQNTYAGSGPLSNDGTLHLATPEEHFAIPLDAADTLGQIVTKINAVCLGEIVAANNGGRLELTAAKRGVNSEIFVVGVSALSGGTAPGFLTELGEIEVSVDPTVVTQGTYPDYVDFYCSAPGVLTVNGMVVSTATQESYLNWVVGTPASPLAHSGQSIIGVNTTAGVGQVNLPGGFGVGDVGRTFTIKWEAGANVLTVSGNGANIDGGASVVMASLYQSLTVYWGGTQWFIR